jgi:hypothetical protein
MKMLMQHAHIHPTGQGDKKMANEPGWANQMSFGSQNPGEPVIDFKNLPPGSYFGKQNPKSQDDSTRFSPSFHSDEPPVYIDPTTGKEISPTEIEQLQSPTELGVNPNVSVTISSQCNDPSCSNCKKN